MVDVLLTPVRDACAVQGWGGGHGCVVLRGTDVYYAGGTDRIASGVAALLPDGSGGVVLIPIFGSFATLVRGVGTAPVQGAGNVSAERTRVCAEFVVKGQLWRVHAHGMAVEVRNAMGPSASRPVARLADFGDTDDQKHMQKWARCTSICGRLTILVGMVPAMKADGRGRKRVPPYGAMLVYDVRGVAADHTTDIQGYTRVEAAEQPAVATVGIFGGQREAHFDYVVPNRFGPATGPAIRMRGPVRSNGPIPKYSLLRMVVLCPCDTLVVRDGCVYDASHAAAFDSDGGLWIINTGAGAHRRFTPVNLPDGVRVLRLEVSACGGELLVHACARKAWDRDRGVSCAGTRVFVIRPQGAWSSRKYDIRESISDNGERVLCYAHLGTINAPAGPETAAYSRFVLYRPV